VHFAEIRQNSTDLVRPEFKNHRITVHNSKKLKIKKSEKIYVQTIWNSKITGEENFSNRDYLVG
jgi:hypothetical protein